LSRGNLLKTLKTSSVAASMSFSPDGRLLMTAADSGTLETWGVAP
jgi:hypothetical protein